MKPVGVEIYEGCRTPSISSNFTASPASPNLGPSASARESYEGLSRTPDWPEFSRGFSDAEDKTRRISHDSSFTWSEVSVQSLPASAEGDLFESADIVRITNGFRWLIGKSGFGTLYHGKLIDQTDVSVKVFSHEICYETELFNQFILRIQRLVTIKHKNLLGVIGYCFEGKNNVLVMEPLPPGKLRSLADRVGDHEEPLTWVQRFQIALDVAQALEYLHHGCNPPIIHGNVNIDNILLDEKLNARLADCGFSKAVYEEYPASPITNPPKYSEPSFIINRYMNEQSDEYDFGIVLWSLITDDQPWVIETSISQNVRLFRWNRPSVANATKSLAYTPWRQGTSDSESSSLVIKKGIKIVERCTVAAHAKSRLTMTRVVDKLKDCLRSLQPTSTILKDKRPGLPPKPSQNFQAR